MLWALAVVGIFELSDSRQTRPPVRGLVLNGLLLAERCHNRLRWSVNENAQFDPFLTVGID
jgi:hypothetical protein